MHASAVHIYIHLHAHTNIHTQAGGLAPLIILLSSPLPRIQEQAAVALRNISLTEENETALVHEGGLPPLLELLHHTDDHIVEQALVTLRNIR